MAAPSAVFTIARAAEMLGERTTSATRPSTRCASEISDKEMARLDGLQPMAGMPIEVFIKTAQRTVASYQTKPLRERIDRAFRGR